MRLGSLFTGYGGLDRGTAAVLDTTTVWHSEIDPAAAAVLTKRAPGVPNLGDITSVDWRHVPRVDVLTGGFPCQDISLAGSQTRTRKGLDTGTRSGLWTAMAEAIEHLRPRLVIIENVRGIISAPAAIRAMGPLHGGLDTGRGPTALEAVLADLADLGMDARWLCLPAAEAGAPHHRWRAFIAAAPHAHRFDVRRRREPPDLASTRGQVGEEGSKRHRDPADRDPATDLSRYGRYAPAIHRWERILGRRAPDPVQPRPDGKPQLAQHFVEWMMGLPDGWITDVPGLSRTAMLRLLGNGVVPQQAALAAQILLDDAHWATP